MSRVTLKSWRCAQLLFVTWSALLMALPYATARAHASPGVTQNGITSNEANEGVVVFGIAKCEGATGSRSMSLLILERTSNDRFLEFTKHVAVPAQRYVSVQIDLPEGAYEYQIQDDATKCDTSDYGVAVRKHVLHFEARLHPSNVIVDRLDAAFIFGQTNRSWAITAAVGSAALRCGAGVNSASIAPVPIHIQGTAYYARYDVPPGPFNVPIVILRNASSTRFVKMPLQLVRTGFSGGGSVPSFFRYDVGADVPASKYDDGELECMENNPSHAPHARPSVVAPNSPSSEK